MFCDIACTPQGATHAVANTSEVITLNWVTKTFHFFKNDIGFINKLLDDLSVIDLIADAKVIRFAGRAAEV